MKDEEIKIALQKTNERDKERLEVLLKKVRRLEQRIQNQLFAIEFGPAAYRELLAKRRKKNGHQ